MSTVRDIRMIRRADSALDYRQAPESEVRRRLAKGTIVFEGVDGDEEANTVTYWYRPADERDER